MIREYLRLIVFTAGLLIGVQLPAFVDQYHKRVDAHFNESRQNLSGFQLTADKYFKGNIQELIEHYQSSNDPVNREDSKNIAFIYKRYQTFQNEITTLQGKWYLATYHVIFRHQIEILDETLKQYSYTVPLNPRAIAWGVGVGFCLSFFIESLFGLLFWIIKSSFSKFFSRVDSSLK